MSRLSSVSVLILTAAALGALACSDTTSSNGGGQQTPMVYELPATQETAIPVAVASGQRVEITTTGQVSTNPDGPVEGCDLWTDADGLPECMYVTYSPECHGLPFMALIGRVDADYFLVGTAFDSTFAAACQLDLLVNDWVHADNDGTFTISVLVH